MPKRPSATPVLGPKAPAAQQPCRDVFIARQPILDLSLQVIGYELLFRASASATAFAGSPDQATARIITDAVSGAGLDHIANGRLAFINITRGMLVDGVPAGLPPKSVVLELVEDIVADDDVLKALRGLKREGYTIALDDFLPSPENAALLPFVDYVKMRFHEITDVPAWIHAASAGRPGAAPHFVAEQIETHEDHERARKAGLSHFQGYFFGRPVTQRTREIPDGRLGYLRLLQALRDPEITIPQLEALIKPDAALCFRVLRTVNSAAFGLRTEVSSIREALVMLGRDHIRRWASVWAMASVAGNSHSELLVTAIVRARVCELLTTKAAGGTGSADGFLLGMCSVLDAIFDAPMDVVVRQLPLAESLRGALMGEDTPQRRLLESVLAYERGDWDRWNALAGIAGLDPMLFASASADALKWAGEACRGVQQS